ncbi:UNVERIFIED_CONTAM: hypothetical protein FKN15_074828 [Acipenser sinensis]
MDATQFAAMMDLLRQTLTAAVQGAARTAAPDPQLLRPTKMTAEDRPEAYLEGGLQHNGLAPYYLSSRGKHKPRRGRYPRRQ